jgi:hypothetical protein
LGLHKIERRKKLDFIMGKEESILFLYIQTLTKGSDIEAGARLGIKSKEGLKDPGHCRILLQK